MIKALLAKHGKSIPELSQITGYTQRHLYRLQKLRRQDKRVQMVLQQVNREWNNEDR